MRSIYRAFSSTNSCLSSQQNNDLSFIGGNEELDNHTYPPIFDVGVSTSQENNNFNENITIDGNQTDNTQQSNNEGNTDFN